MNTSPTVKILLFLILCFFTQFSTAQTSSVTFYSEAKYWGDQITLKAGNHSSLPNSVKGRGNVASMNDRISSIKIPPSWKVVAYEHSNFRGRSITLTQSISNLQTQKFNDIISSVKITAPKKSPLSSRFDKFKPTAPSGSTISPPSPKPVANTTTPCEKIKNKMDEIRAEATEGAKSVIINCNLTLSPNDVITKQLIFEGSDASGITCDCNGATLDGSEGKINYRTDMIEVRSSHNKKNNTWKRPENITIKNCNIIGSVRIWGMGRTGEDIDIRESSRKETVNSKHPQRVRNNAPKNIHLEKLIITGVGRNPLYFSPGVTYSKLINSEIKGKSDVVGMYLDTESAYNTIKNNFIHVATPREGFVEKEKSRPQLAIDGSSRNKIINNTFAELYNGGIYLYRNCGEGGTIRHTPPEHNTIVNNVFIYKRYKKDKPAIYLGSRDGNKNYCDDDKGWAFGSSASNKDFARYNVIMQNQFYRRGIYKNSKLEAATLSDMIKSKNYTNNSPNYIKYNDLVSNKINRKAGCYVKNGYKDFLLHGESMDAFNINGKLACNGQKFTCNDGELIVSSSSNCSITEVPFECLIEGNNNGCSKTITAPPGKHIVGIKVACNLEFGTISNSQLSSIPINEMKVVKTSEDVNKGICYIGSNSIRKGAKTLSDIQDQLKLLIGCKEHDKNGGDCHIKGILYCR